ncbi:RNA polymerase sigma factor [Patescibacteria group bacterium]|nr:RNA polymerase sigma factor [Patescibacteria group bacterium]
MDEAREYFSKIYDEYVEHIYRFVYLKTGSPDIAQDLCSDVFLRGWQAYKSPGTHESGRIVNMRAFLYQLARNVIADHYRKGEKMQFLSLEQTAIEFVDFGEGPDEMAGTRLEIDQIRIAILEIPEDYQNLLIWRYLDDLSIPEICQLTGKSEEAVRVGIHRGLRRLKEYVPEALPQLKEAEVL